MLSNLLLKLKKNVTRIYLCMHKIKKKCYTYILMYALHKQLLTCNLRIIDMLVIYYRESWSFNVHIYRSFLLSTNIIIYYRYNNSGSGVYKIPFFILYV
jgi:hypothetical protein